jgi:hypothetical protein
VQIGVRVLPGLAWRLENVRFQYFPSATDDSLYAVSEAAKRHAQFVVIVPPQCDVLFRNALYGLHDGLVPAIFSLDGLLTWRMLWAPADLSITHDEARYQLIASYNRRARRGGASLISPVKLRETRSKLVSVRPG